MLRQPKRPVPSDDCSASAAVAHANATEPAKPPASEGLLERAARQVTKWSGGTPAFVTATFMILVWLATGPIFRYSNTWQLVINTSTTIVTFLMVFLIQRAQNKESRALHLKLDEVIAATRGASNRLIRVEEQTEAQLAAFDEGYRRLLELAASDPRPTIAHSIEEAPGVRESSRPAMD